MKKLYLILPTLLIVLLSGRNLFSQGNINLVNYGPKSELKEGDDDFLQVIFFKIPENESESFTVKLFDIDCGNAFDLAYGEYDSRFKFSLYGGPGAFTSGTITSHHPSRSDLNQGTHLKTLFTGNEDRYDNIWIDFITLQPDQGELVNGSYHFKLIVEGISGNDANVFNVEARYENKDDNIAMINYCPTFRLRVHNNPVQLRFTPTKNYVSVHNFDADGGKIKFTTPFRSDMQLTSSHEGHWEQDAVSLEHIEVGQVCALEFGPGFSKVNDVTFYIEDDEGKSLPFQLPIVYPVYNTRPVIQKEISVLNDCRTFMFDAGKTNDPDRDEINFKWYLNEILVSEQSMFEHRIYEPGTYPVTLTVQDNSGAVENGSVERFSAVVNQSPVAVAGQDINTVPDKSIRFDAANSYDNDGRITSYNWDLGDGSISTSQIYSHTYSNPGTYKVILEVTDNSNSTCNFSADTIGVFVNARPVANAGENILAAVGELINFSGADSYDDDGEIVSYIWQFGDGQSESGMIVSHTYSTPGKYTAKLTVKDNTSLENNTASDNVELIINYPPVAIAGEDIVAAIDEELNFDAGKSFDTDGIIAEYKWDFGDGNSATGKNITHTYNKPGQYVVRLHIKDDSPTLNNISSDSLTIVINSSPVAIAGDDIFQTDPVVTFNALNSYDEDGSIVSYKWDFGDGSSGSQPESEYYYREPGDYKVGLTVVDNTKTKNNTARTNLNVKINARPVADAGPDITVAPGEQFFLTGANSVDPDGNIVTYVWSLDNTVVSSNESFQHKFEEPGFYSFSLKVGDDSQHLEAFDYDNVSIHVNSKPFAIAGPDIRISPGEPFTLDASKSYDTDGEITDYSWDVDGEIISDNAVIEHTINDPGIYSISLKVTDNSASTNSSASDQLIAAVNSPPVPKITDGIFTCDKQVTFDASLSADSDGDPLTYTWDFGDNSERSSGVYIIHSYDSSGTYPVILSVDDGKGQKNSIVTTAMNVRINSTPIAIAGANETVCSGEIITLSASDSYDNDGDLLKYYWDFGDGSSSEGISAIKSFNTAGLYIITLNVMDNSGLECNSGTDTKLIQVVESPVANAGPDLNGCTRNPVMFDGSRSTDSDGIVNSYFWDFGDGSTGGGVNTTHSYKNSGVYKVLLTITGELIGDCDNSDTDELIVTVTDAPYAEFSSPDSIAVGNSVTFDASASSAGYNMILDYTWDFGDDSTASGRNVTHYYDKHGFYKVKLSISTDSKSQCTNSIFEKMIYVNSRPQAEAGINQITSINKTIIFNAAGSIDIDGAIDKYHWDFGDGNYGKGIILEHSYNESGNYDVILSVIDNTSMVNNSDSDTLIVTVNNPPVPKLSSPEYAYVNQEILFDASSSFDPDGNIELYKWILDGQSLGRDNNLVHSFNEPGLHTISLLTIDDSDMKDSVTISRNIMIYKIPVITLSADKIVCRGQEIIVDANHDLYNTPSGLTYKWQSSSGVNIPGDSILSITADELQNNSITLSLLDYNYVDKVLSTAKYIPEINTAPVAVAGDDKQVYIGGANDAAVFDGTSSFDKDGDPLSYTWDLGDGNSAVGSIVTHNYTKPGKYTIKLTVSDNRQCDCSSSDDEIIVEVVKR